MALFLSVLQPSEESKQLATIARMASDPAAVDAVGVDPSSTRAKSSNNVSPSIAKGQVTYSL